MVIVSCQASFKNSRIFTRSATISAQTGTITVKNAGTGATANGNTSIRPATSNRVILTIKNESTTDTLRYGYSDSATPATSFFELGPQQAIDILSPQEVFAAGSGVDVKLSFDEGIG